MFLWIVVSSMVVALAAEIVCVVGIAITASAAVKRMMLVKKEFSKKLQASISLAKEVRQSLQPEFDKFRRDGAQIAPILGKQFRAMQAVWQDASRRKQRLQLRLSREGGATVERLQRDRHIVRRGVLMPIRAVTSVALGVRATSWLLRKVA